VQYSFISTHHNTWRRQMTECPHCQQELKVASIVQRNMEAYGKPVLYTTNCCEKGVRLNPVFSYTVEPYTGDRKEDDWGEKFRK
jgi:C4-type Zn-finger protein